MIWSLDYLTGLVGKEIEVFFTGIGMRGTLLPALEWLEGGITIKQPSLTKYNSICIVKSSIDAIRVINAGDVY